MYLHASELLDQFKKSGVLIAHQGPDTLIQGIAPLEQMEDHCLVFIEKPRYLSALRQAKPAAVVTNPAIAAELTGCDFAVLVAPNPRLAQALIRQRYGDRDLFHTEWPQVHPSAVVHPSADIGSDVVIGPLAVVGADVKLAGQNVVMAGSVIEQGARIGLRSVIYPHCVIGYDCEIGADVIIKSGAVIGSEGFGFAQDEARRNHRIPHTGKVVIEDRVVIGANCTIDRGTFNETRIRRGCVIDALCHLGHNVELGEDCILVAQTGIAGSSRFGKRVIASGQTGVLDHVTVPDDTVLVHRAGVINSIKQPGRYAATPTQPFRQYLKNIAVFQRLHEVWTRLKALEKKVQQLALESE